MEKDCNLFKKRSVPRPERWALLKRWNESYKNRKKYSRNKPYCSYDFVSKYLPESSSAKILDIGCGNALFEDYLNLSDKYETIYLLDGYIETVKNLKERYNHTMLYKVPDDLPFKDESIDFIYCSHLIEHLDTMDTYKLFKEMNRVLVKNGILVFRSPTLWKFFFGTFTHERVYDPMIFLPYFCGENTTNIALPPVSEDYTILEKIYRYDTSINLDEGIGSPIKIIDAIIQFFKLIFKRALFKTYTRTGYTIILRKGGV